MYLTVIEFAAKCGVTAGRVRVWARAGRIPAVKTGRDWLISDTATRPEDARIVENPIRNRRKK